MKRFGIITAFLCAASCALGQSYYQNNAYTTSYINGKRVVSVIEGVKVQICSNISGACVQQPVYSDSELSQPITQPMPVDGSGNFGFWIPNGTYSYRVLNSQGVQIQAYPFTTSAFGDVVSLQHNSSASGIDQSLLNFCDNGSCGEAVPSGQQKVTFGPDASGGWSGWTAAATGNFTPAYQVPMSGNHIIMLPFSCTTSSASFGSSICGAAPSYSLTNYIYGHASLSQVTTTVTGWAYNGVEGLPSFISPANVTAIYGGVQTWWSGSPTACGGSPFDEWNNGTSNFGAGISNAYPYPATYYLMEIDGGSPATFNYSTAYFQIGNQQSTICSGSSTRTALSYIVVYYTGPAPPATNTLTINSPFTFANNTLGLNWPINAGIDNGTSTAYAVQIPWLKKTDPVTGASYNDISPGATIWVQPAHNNSTTTPTLNLNSIGAANILGNGSSAVAVGDILAGKMAEFVLGVDGAWHLLNPMTGGGAVSSLTTTGTSGAAALSSGVLNIPQYQGALTVTTTGTSGAATLTGNTLNIPNYSTGSGTGFNGGLGSSYQDAAEIAAPANPAAGNDRLYLSSTTHQLSCLTSAGASCMPSGGGGSLPTATQPGQIISSAAAGTTYSVQPNIFYSQAGDTIASIEAECSTACTYVVTIPQTFTLAGSHTLSATVNVEFKSAGLWTVNGAGFVLTIGGGVSGPPTQHFAGTASILLSANTPFDYAEWFGAKGDGTTDDSAAIQAAINAVEGGGAAGTNAGTGSVRLLAKTYLANTGLTITVGHVGLIGTTQGDESGTSGTVIKTTSPSITQLSVGSGAISPNYVQHITFYRAVQPTGTATGISVNGTWKYTQDDVSVMNSIRGMYIANTGSGGTGYIDNTNIKWLSATVNCASATYYGIYIDESAGTTPSLRIRNSQAYSDVACSNMYGLYATGPQIEDIHVRHFETGHLGYGVYLNSTGGAAYQNADNHFQDAIMDQCQVSCYYITGMTNAGNSSVSIQGGWVNGESSSPAIDIENSNGVMAQGVSIGSVHASRTYIKVNGGSQNNLTGNDLLPLQSSSTGILLNSTTNNVVSSNTIRGNSTTSVVGISLVGATRTVLSGNSLSGSMTTGVSLDATSNNNDLYNVAQIDPTSITTPVSNSGSNNQIGVGNMNNPMAAVGDLIAGGTAGTPSRVAGNTSATTECLTQTGTGTASAAPVWGSCAGTGGSIVLENGGTSLGSITTLNCSSGTTCGASAGVGTITASGSGNHVNLCAVLTLTNATCSGGAIVANTGVSSVKIQSIPGTYLTLHIDLGANGSGAPNIILNFNGDAATNYKYLQFYAAPTGGAQVASATGTAAPVICGASVTTYLSACSIDIPFYSVTGAGKTAIGFDGHDAGASGYFHAGNTVEWSGTAAISEIDLSASSGTFGALRVALYGNN